MTRFDVEFGSETDPDEPVKLPLQLQERLIDWCQLLVHKGYELSQPFQVWDAAGYLVANNFAYVIVENEPVFFNVGETGCILAFAVDNWDEIRNMLADENPE